MLTCRLPRPSPSAPTTGPFPFSSSSEDIVPAARAGTVSPTSHAETNTCHPTTPQTAPNTKAAPSHNRRTLVDGARAGGSPDAPCSAPPSSGFFAVRASRALRSVSTATPSGGPLDAARLSDASSRTAASAVSPAAVLASPGSSQTAVASSGPDEDYFQTSIPLSTRSGQPTR